MADLFNRVVGKAGAGGSLFDRVMQADDGSEAWRTARDKALGAFGSDALTPSPKVDLGREQARGRGQDAANEARYFNRSMTPDEESRFLAEKPLTGDHYAREARALAMRDRFEQDFGGDDWATIGRKTLENFGPSLRQALGAGITEAYESARLAGLPSGTVPLQGGGYANLRQMVQDDLDKRFAAKSLPGQGLYDWASKDLAENAIDPGSSHLKEIAKVVADSAPAMIAGIVAGFATKNPVTGLEIGSAVGAAPQGTIQYMESRGEGRSTDLSNLDSAVNAISEYFGNRIELGMLMKPGGKFLPRLFKNAGAEAISEGLTQTVQSLYDKGVIHPDTPWSEVGKQILLAAEAGGAMGAGFSGAIDTARAGRDAIRVATAPLNTPKIEGLDLTGRPALDAAIVAAAQPTQADIASPLDTSDIVAGKAEIARTSAQSMLDDAAKGAGLPTVGQRVEIQTPEGQDNLTGTLREIFGDAGDQGLNIELDTGGSYREYLNDIRDAGHTVVPIGTGAKPGTPGAGLKRLIRASESSGNDQAQNPLSSASGRYQFTSRTFVDTYKQVFGDSESDAEILAKKNDPAIQEKLMDRLLANNGRALSKAGFEASDGNLYLAHVLGAQGAINALRNPDASAREVLGDKVVNANPFMRDMTAGDVVAWAEQRVGGKEATPAPRFADTGTPTDTGTDFLNVALNSNKIGGEDDADAGGPTPSPGDLGDGGGVSAPVTVSLPETRAGASDGARVAPAEGSSAATRPQALRVYHGGEGLKGDIRPPLYVNEDRAFAQSYANDRGRSRAVVDAFDMAPSKIAEAADIDEAARAVGVHAKTIEQVPAGMLLDQQFNEDAPKVIAHLREQGFDVARFSDFAADDERNEKISYAVLDPKVLTPAERQDSSSTPAGDGTRTAPIEATEAAHVDQAAANVAAPTEAQKEAGNYQKGHVRVQGLDITIETPKGAERSGVDPNGKPWSVNMPDHYGYVKRTEGADGDHVDVYVGPNPKSDRVFVVDQVDAKTGKFDEHKAMLGYDSEAGALAAYDAAFSDGKGAQRRKAVSEVSADEFKAWLNDGNTRKPFAVEKTVNRRRSGAASGPEDMASFIASMGGIADTEGHDLKGGRGLGDVFIPGYGKLVRKNGGKTIDEIGEALHEAGFFGPASATERPTTADVLEKIDELTRRKIYRPEDQAEIDAKANGEEQEQERQARADEIEARFGELGVPLVPAELDDVLALVAKGLSVEEAVDQWLMSEASLAFEEARKELGYAPEYDFDFPPIGATDEQSSQDERGADQADEAGERSAGEQGRASAGEEAAAGRGEASGATEGQLDAFGTRAGDQRAKLERDAEGRAKAKAPQKAPGSDGGLFDTRDTTGDIFDQAPAAPAAPRIEDTTSGKGIAVFGTPEQIAQISKALPKASGMARADGATVYSKKYEADIRGLFEGSKMSASPAAAKIDTRDGWPVEQDVRDLARDDNRYAVRGGAVLTTQSGRKIGPAPKFNDTTRNTRSRSLATQAEWLLSEAQAEAKQAQPGTLGYNAYPSLARERADNLPPATWSLINEVLFDDPHGPPNRAPWTSDRAPPPKNAKPAPAPTGRADGLPSPFQETADGEAPRPQPRNPGTVQQMPGNRTLKEHETQGWNAADSGWAESDNPYLETSSAWEAWRRGFRSHKPSATPSDAFQASSPAGNTATSAGAPAPAPSRPSGYGSKNKIITADKAAELRAQLREKFNRFNSGVDPETFAIGAQLAIFHLEAGARKFADFVKAMVEDIGQPASVLKPYLRGWYSSAQMTLEDHGEDVSDLDGPGAVRAAVAMIEAAPAETNAPQQKPVAPANTGNPLRDAFINAFVGGRSFASITDARAFARDLTGGDFSAGTANAKQLDEAIESAVVFAARNIAANAASPQVAYQRLVELYEQQPKLGVRSSTSVEQQAYSTPVPLAYLAGRLAGVDSAKTVYEPSAGNGALLITATPANVTANELNPDRAAKLRDFLPGGTVSTEDATKFDAGDRSFDVVIENPPFGPVKDEDGDTKRFYLGGGYETNEIDHAIAIRSLEAMKENGKAVLIVGGINKKITDPKGRRDAYNGKAKREFYYRLYQTYNVVDHFTVDGDLYAKQGAGWPVDVIVIDGRGKSSLPLPAVQAPRQYESWQSLGEVLNENGQSIDRPARIESGSDLVEGTRPASGNVRAAGNGGVVGNRGRERSNPDEQPGAVRDRPVAGQPGRARLGGDSSRVGGPDEGNGPSGADRRPDPVETAENDKQVAYKPGSGAAPMGTLVPVNMQTAISQALANLKARVGDIDGFVADKLGYAPGKLSSFFGAEQVDAIALALDNMERGAGFIIGDQTGIGKGRVVAAIIRYAMKQGLTPVFVTEKPNLYADMFRDLTDVGVPQMLGRDLNILMTNSSEKVPLDEEGKLVLKSGAAATHGRLLEEASRKGLKAAGYDVVFTTYAQMQTVKGEETVRQRALAAFANGGILIMDESHNAGGTVVKQERKSKKQKEAEEAGNAPLNRAQFARALVQSAKGVFYSSATYAKRPDVMDLYSATDMKLAVDDLEKLGEAIQKGGVPMQQVVAAMLAEAGQYVRRERSFDGIAYNTPTVTVERAQYEAASSILRAIQDFTENHVGEATEAVDDEVRNEAAAVSFDGSIGSAGATSTNFTSIMHNVIDQMLLAFKADAAADMAIAAIKRGEKPVITVANTMESMISEFAEEMGLKIGDEIPLTFADVFARYLERSRWITIKKPFSSEKGERKRLTDQQLGPAGTAAFRDVMRQIRDSGLDALPGSPIDWMTYRIEQAGYKVGEITGRGMGVTYRDGKAYLKSRGDNVRSIKGRLQTITGFNGGPIDATILNRSGSTGLSLHASAKFKDKRKRRMIIAQAEGNIDTHMQMLGRVHRTGQVVLPEYDQLVAGVPAEKRPAAVLAKKMASLNANTTASRDSAVTAKDVLDFMNEYGDEVVATIMENNPDLHDLLARPLKQDEDGNYVREDAARKVTGRIPLLPTSEQEELYDLIENEYRDYLAQKEAAGENALEAKTLDLDAETLDSQVVKPGKDGYASPFAGPVMAETVEINSQGRPFTAAEVVERVAESAGLTVPAGSPRQALEALARQARQAHVDMLNAAYSDGQAFIRTEQADMTDPAAARRLGDKLRENATTFRALTNALELGSPVRLATDNGYFYGIVTNVEKTGNAKNPLALSGWKASFAILDSGRSLTFPLTKLTLDESDKTKNHVQTRATLSGQPVIEAFDTFGGGGREKRTIITGNLLSGYDEMKGRGTIINYTTRDGGLKQGILMRRGFDLAKEQASRPVVFSSPEAVSAWMKENGDITGQVSGEGQINLMVVNGRLMATVARSKKEGGFYFLNRKLTDALGTDFYSRSSGMVASAHESRLGDVLAVLKDMGVKFAIPETARQEVKDKARAINERFQPQQRVATNNFDQSRAPIDVEAAKAELRAALRKLDPMGRINLNVIDRAFPEKQYKNTAGLYWPGARLIEVVVNHEKGATNEYWTLHHEAVHAFRDMGLWTQAEWAALVEAATKDQKKMAEVRKRWAHLDLTEEGFQEEAVAELFGEYAAWEAEFNGKTTPTWLRALGKAVTFLSGLLRVIRGKTWTPIAYRIMDQALSGEIGSRPAARAVFGRKPFQEDGPAEAPLQSVIAATPDEATVADLTERAKGLLGDVRGKWDDFRTAMQDRMLPVLRAQAAAEQVLGRALHWHENPYMAEELMTGRVGAQLAQLQDRYIAPLFDAMKADKITPAELESYLYARHAAERNAAIDKINPDLEGRGSGMSDVEAQAILNRINGEGRTEAFERAAAHVWNMLKFARDLKADSGLLSEEQLTAWEQTYQHYVPLKGFEELDGVDARPNRGSGISVRGQESKRAFGRRSQAKDILAHAIMQAEEAIIRAQKNEVARKLYNLAKAAPDDEFWKLNKVTSKRRLNPDTGLVEYYFDRNLQPEDADYTISLKIDGKEKRVTLNKANPAAVRVAEAMRRLNEGQADKAVRMLGAVNRWLSHVNTTLNPEFVISNAFRDLQEGAINLQAEDVRGLARGVLKDYFPAMYAATKGAFGRETGRWGQWYQEFVEDGGKIAFNQLQDLSSLQARLEREVKAMQAKALSPGTMALHAKGALKAFFNTVENVNSGVENGIRLATYKNAREKGMTREQAASLAKNLTINFNRKGGSNWALILNSAYLFYNASVQGSARMVLAIGKSRRVQGIVATAVLTGFMLDALNRLLSPPDDDDEQYYDKIGEWEKEHNLILMQPGGKGRYWKLPLPYGYGTFFTVGRSMSELVHGKNPLQVGGHLVGAIVDAFNPVGGTQSLLNFIAPSVLDPVVDLAQNKDFAGRPIVPNQPDRNATVPNSQLYWSSTSPIWRSVSDTLNDVSGGDKVRPGAIDISPEVFEHLFGQVTGAAGQFYERPLNLAAKAFDPQAEITAGDIPFARKVVGGKPAWYDRSLFYARIQSVEQSTHDLKAYAKLGDVDALKGFVGDERDKLMLGRLARQSRKALGDLRKAQKALDTERDKGGLDKADYNARTRQLKDVQERIIVNFNKTWNDRLGVNEE